MSSKEAIKTLNEMTNEDYSEVAHSEADAVLLNYLESLGEPHASVAKAFEDARDRVRFWYA